MIWDKASERKADLYAEAIKKLIAKSIDEREASMEAQTEYWKLGNKFTVRGRLIN